MSSVVVDKAKVPWWVSNVIVPLVNLTLALIVSGLFVFIAGENPIEAVKLILYGSFGYIQGFAYTSLNNVISGLKLSVCISTVSLSALGRCVIVNFFVATSK